MSPKAVHFNLQAMQVTEVDSVCNLIGAAMNAAEAGWARQTFDFHFACQAQGLDDGRRYYTCQLESNIVAIGGLHHYDWGPAENVWLAWFAVHPDYQRQGLGRRMLAELEVKARDAGYRKFFIETYEHPDFASAQRFYQACGFAQHGRIANYLSDAEDMLVYGKMVS